jgi:hypothetical protein
LIDLKMIVFLHWIWNDYDAIYNSCLALNSDA